MKNDKFVKIVADNKEEIEKILGIDHIKEENKMLRSLLSKIFNTDDNGALKKENKEFKHKNKALKQQNTVLSQKNDALQSDLDALKSDLKALNAKTQENPPTRLKNIYDSLDQSTKSALDSLFKSEKEHSLFASGIVNIKAVWDYAAYLIKEHKDSEFEKVKDIFYLLFETFKTVKNVSLQEVTKGDKFDMDYFSRDNRSDKQSGKVAEIVLKGFLENGKIAKKSIVKVT